VSSVTKRDDAREERNVIRKKQVKILRSLKSARFLLCAISAYALRDENENDP